MSCYQKVDKSVFSSADFIVRIINKNKCIRYVIKYKLYLILYKVLIDSESYFYILIHVM